MDCSFVSIAIDGPSGAGKSTVAKMLAGRLGYIYVDTGALYRALGLLTLESGVDPSDTSAVISLLDNAEVNFGHIDGQQHVFLNGEDVSDRIRTPEVASAASTVSAIPEVRKFLLHLQRDIARNNSIIMDGRDIGTVILPDATYKIYMTATPAERARRRLADLRAKGEDVTYEQVLHQINQRDYNDSHRAVSPLRKAEDAVFLDNTGMDEEGSVAGVLSIMRQKGFDGDLR